MFLVSAKVGPFKSIDKSEEVKIDRAATVLVGMNEAGKTIFLQALEKSNDVLGLAEFDPIDDYPRKNLPAYLRIHDAKPAEATVLTYALTDEEVDQLNKELHTKVKTGFEISITHSYDLPAGSRIIDRLERHIKAKGITIRPSGGFNHYTVASYFASNPSISVQEDTLRRFEALFKTVNALF